MNYIFGQKARLRSRLSVLSFLLLSVILLLPLTGCVTLRDIEASQEQSTSVIGVIDAEHNLGQTLVSRRGRLNGLTLWLGLAPDTASIQGQLIVNLFHTPQDTTPIRQIYLPYQDIALSSPVNLTFMPLPDPPEQPYFLSLQTHEGKILVYGNDSDVYPQGNAYLNGKTLTGDIAFRLTYDYNATAFFEDLLSFISQGWILLSLIVILILPGWLLLNWANIQLSGSEQVSLSLGLSLSLIPLLMSWTTILRITWNQSAVLITSGCLTFIASWHLWKRKGHRIKFNDYDITLAIIFFVVLLVRWIMVRDLTAPPWVDSVHHGVITRLILEQGLFPETYKPYLDVENARYHPGYHATLATFIWLTRLELTQAMLIFGQVLNALMVLAVYQFTFTITRKRIAGIMAALITGILTPMPAYYTSWGRYTQLTGLLILPTCLALIHRSSFALSASSSSKRLTVGIHEHWKIFLLTSIATAGLFLVHYRVTAFLVCYLGVDFIVRFISNLINKTLGERSSPLLEPNLAHGLLSSSQEISPSIAPLPEIVAYLTVATTSFILLLPWLPPTIRTLFIPKLSLWQGAHTTPLDGFSWNYLTAAWGKYSLYAAGIGALWAIINRERFPIILILWVTSMYFLANLSVWGLPGSGFINNTSVTIALFIPISACGGYLVAQVYQKNERLSQHWLQVAYLFIFWGATISFSFLAARQLVTILNPITFLFRQADQKALDWIAENVPSDETIVINPFAWGYGLYAGNDGGYWITPLTGRKTLPPPVLYALGNNLEDVRFVNNLVQQIINSGGNAEQLYSLMKYHGLHYLYIGKRGGLFSPHLLMESPLFRKVYEGEGTWVFHLQ